MGYLVWLARHHFHSDFDVNALKAKKKEIMEAMLVMLRDVPPTKMRKLFHQMSSNSEEEEEEESRSPNKRPRRIIESSSDSEQEANPNPKRARKEVVATSRNVPEEGETSGETAGEATEATAGAAPGATAEAAAKVAKGKRVHHKTSCCHVPGWSFKGQDLIRHLRRVHL